MLIIFFIYFNRLDQASFSINRAYGLSQSSPYSKIKDMIKILFLLISSALAMSSGKPSQKQLRKHSSLPSETTISRSQELSLSSLSILPRPDVNPQFGGAENRLCYNYANLLVRNGLASANDSIISDANLLLSSIYQYGRIIIHHTATWQTPRQIIEGAINYNGWADTGYHYMISWDGSITEGRSLFYMGANAGQIPDRSNDCSNNKYYMDKDNDYRSIGIALIGNFDIYHPSSAQIESLTQLINSLKERFKITEVKPHRHFKATQCPGNNFMATHSNLFDDVTAEEQQLSLMSSSPFIPRSSNPPQRNICYSCQ